VTITFDAIRDYHVTHGDDYGSEQSRKAKYAAVLSMLDLQSWHTLLDVGCGDEHFRECVGCEYLGIDLVRGENVMDWDVVSDWVVANGILYKLHDEREAQKVLEKCWSLARVGFVFTSLDRYKHFCEAELTLDPFEMARWADKRANGIVLRLDYKPGDFAVLMLR